MKRFEMIKNKNEFNNIIRHGKYTKNKYFVIYYIDNIDNNTKFGIAIKKSIGLAVIRNRLKRQTRAIIDNNRILFKNSHNYIIMIREGCLLSSFKDMNEALVNLMKGTQK